MPNNSQKYATAFSSSLYPNTYLIQKGSSSWIPFSASTREPNDVAMQEIIDETFYEIFTQSENIPPITTSAEPQSFINFVENGYLELKGESENIYNSTGAFAIEALFKLNCVPEWTPDEKATIFKADQTGIYSADFPFHVGNLPPLLEINNIQCTTGACWEWPKYPVSWECNRGYTLGLQKHNLPNINTNNPKLKFVINTNNKIAKDELGWPLPPWDYISWQMGFQPGAINPNPQYWKIIDVDGTIPQNKRTWMTGSGQYLNEWVPNWFYNNMITTETSSYEIQSSASINYNNWYYVVVTYGDHQYSPYTTKTKITIRVKNLSTNEEWYNENNNINIGEKILPCYSGVIGTTQSIGAYRITPTPLPNPGNSENWPWLGNWYNVFWGFDQNQGGAFTFVPLNYDIHTPINDQKIKISHTTEQFFGDVKYVRFWNKQFDGNTDTLIPHSGSYNYSDFINDPNIDIGSLIMFPNMSEGSGDTCFDASAHGMNYKLKTGSDSSDICQWKSGTI